MIHISERHFRALGSILLTLAYLFHFEGSTIEVVLVHFLHCLLHELLSPKLNHTETQTPCELAH